MSLIPATWAGLGKGGTVRNPLETILVKAGNQLDDEAFRTFITEVECIVNSRPLTIANLCSSHAPEPLTPNHLLTMKPKIVLPPPAKFQQPDVEESSVFSQFVLVEMAPRVSPLPTGTEEVGSSGAKSDGWGCSYLQGDRWNT